MPQWRVGIELVLLLITMGYIKKIPVLINNKYTNSKILSSDFDSVELPLLTLKNAFF